MHPRSTLIEAVEAALVAKGLAVIDATDAVQEEDVPCVVIEEREEQLASFDETLGRRATTLRRRLRLVVFAFGVSKRARDDIAQRVEECVVPAAVGAGFQCVLVGVGYSRSKLGTSAAAFVAGQFYDAEYMTPTYAPA